MLSSASRDMRRLAPVMNSIDSSGTGLRKCRDRPSQKFTKPPPTLAVSLGRPCTRWLNRPHDFPVINGYINHSL